MKSQLKFRAYVKSQNRIIDLHGFHNDYAFGVTNDSEEIGENIFPLSDVEIMRFTGFKDKNGVEIYQGYIYRHNNNKNFVCVFTDLFGFVFIEINKNFRSVLTDRMLMKSHYNRKKNDLSSFKKYIEIIGNIYENPELLVV
jgi:uncharacterized phage protein (TIGR01671 family)